MDGIGRAAQEWLAINAVCEDARIAGWFGLSFPIDPEHDDIAAWWSLLDLGICATRIIREPQYRISREKADRDAALDRPTIHLAPLWRYPITGEETGIWALMLPVDGGDEPSTLSRTLLGDDGFAESIADLIALPVDGGRPLSMTGYTVAIGGFRGDARHRLTLYGSGLAWLKAHMAQARAVAADTPPHLVEQLHLPFPAPGEAAVLLLEPDALEWRVVKSDCIVPREVQEIACPDSRKLAEMIDQALRKKERPRTIPKVMGPKAGVAA
jgi:hypothetical protein